MTIFEENVTTDNGAKPPIYTCAKCGATFDTQDGVNEHQRAHMAHSVPVTVCRYCGRALGARKRRETHETQCSANPERVPYEFECGHCDETFPSKNGRAMHRHRTHGIESNDPATQPLRKARERKKRSEPKRTATRHTLRIGEQVTRADMLLVLTAFIPDGTIPVTDAARIIDIADAMATLITDLRGPVIDETEVKPRRARGKADGKSRRAASGDTT